jgi:hypothetical protein
MASDWSAEELMALSAQYSERFGSSIPQHVAESEISEEELMTMMKAALASGEPVKEWEGYAKSDLLRPGNEGALPRIGEDHGACDHAVRAVESVDGTTAVVGDDGIAASAAPESARSGPETRVAGPEKPKSVVNVSPHASDVIDEGLFEGLIRPSLIGV